MKPPKKKKKKNTGLARILATLQLLEPIAFQEVGGIGSEVQGNCFYLIDLTSIGSAFGGIHCIETVISK